MSDKQRDEAGQEYEELEGERESGDGDGDRKYVLGDLLTPEQIEKLTRMARAKTS
jgi:hypothetical protein